MAQKTFAGGSRFAHLLGRGKRPAAAKAEDTDEDEEMTRRAKKAEDGGNVADPDENEDEKKDKLDDTLDEHTDEDGTSATTEDGDEDDDTDAKKAARAKARAKAKAEDGDDEADDKDEKDAKASAVRRRERARCAAIFASPAAASRPDFAAHLAFGTAMNRGAAIQMLEAAAAGHQDDERPQQRGGRSLGQRMSRAPAPNVGPNGGARPASGAAGFAAQMQAANKIRHGEA